MDRRQFIFAAAAALIGPPVPTRLFERTVGPDVDVTVELSFGAELGRAGLSSGVRSPSPYSVANVKPWPDRPKYNHRPRCVMIGWDRSAVCAS